MLWKLHIRRTKLVSQGQHPCTKHTDDSDNDGSIKAFHGGRAGLAYASKEDDFHGYKNIFNHWDSISLRIKGGKL